MIKRLRFEKTNSNDYVVMSAGDSKLTLAVIRPENGKWLALLPHNNGSVSVNGVSMAVFCSRQLGFPQCLLSCVTFS